MVRGTIAMDRVNVRNLEEIQEDDRAGRSPRLAVLLLASMGLGALGIVALMSRETPSTPRVSDDQALAELVESHRAKAGEVAPDVLQPGEASFAGVLSDEPNPTTAMVAVRDERGRLIPPQGASSTGLEALLPPAAADKLPVVPLPAGPLLNATPVIQSPRDPMTALAARVSRADGATEEAQAGHEGDFQIQVASFRDREDAEKFAAELRKRGHAAYRQEADVPGRGIWHRVRIGPFKQKFEAEQYRKKLEAKERTAAFIVDPVKVEKAAQARAAKVAAHAALDEG